MLARNKCKRPLAVEFLVAPCRYTAAENLSLETVWLWSCMHASGHLYNWLVKKVWSFVQIYENIPKAAGTFVLVLNQVISARLSRAAWSTFQNKITFNKHETYFVRSVEARAILQNSSFCCASTQLKAWKLSRFKASHKTLESCKILSHFSLWLKSYEWYKCNSIIDKECWVMGS